MLSALVRMWDNLYDLFAPVLYGGGGGALSSILVTTFGIVMELGFVGIAVWILFSS